MDQIWAQVSAQGAETSVRWTQKHKSLLFKETGKHKLSDVESRALGLASVTLTEVVIACHKTSLIGVGVIKNTHSLTDTHMLVHELRCERSRRKFAAVAVIKG